MAVQVRDQAVTTVDVKDVKNESAIIRDGKHPRFQAPLFERRVLLLVVDAVIVLLAGVAAFMLWAHTAEIDLDIVAQIRERWYWFPILLGGWWVVAWLNDLYYIPSSFDKAASVLRVAAAGTVNLVAYLLVVPFIPHNLPRAYFLYFLIIAWAAITLWRLLYAALFSRIQHRILIVGQGERGQSIARVLRQASKLNYHVLGYVDDNVNGSRIASDGLSILGKPAELLDLARQLQVHEVVVANDRELPPNLFEWLVDCQSNGVQVSLMSDIFEKLQRRIPVEHIDPTWAIRAMQGRPVFSRLELGLKRMMDLVLVIVALPVLSLLTPLIALAIRLDSPGGVFYRQVRSGQAGKPFRIIKFRTMCSDAEKDGKPRWASKDDPRITRVGRFLRKTRLDELPQVFNVLRGDMSIVGPRPERPEFIEELQQTIPFYRTRLMIKPGLTGWAQVNYVYGNSSEDALIKLQYDMYYLHHWSLWLDLYVVFRTVAVVFRFKGT